MHVFVTVGTTDFDDLVREVDTPAFLGAVKALGFAKITVQIGRGNKVPDYLSKQCPAEGMDFEFFRFQPSLKLYMESADLIISHCGAGSVLEALTLRKVLLVVTNPTLQGNHQLELAETLHEMKYCSHTEPSQLLRVLQSTSWSALAKDRRDHIADPSLFANEVDSLFDWD